MTVRAYGKQFEFSRITERALDVMNRAYYITIVNQRWLGIRLNFVGNVLIFVVSMLVCTSRFSVSPSISGMILSYCIQIVSVMGQLTRQYAEMQNNMNATERVHYYATAIENEAPDEIPERKPPPSWPDSGEIVMRDVAMRYADGMPLVLKNVSMHIRGGERIGIGNFFRKISLTVVGRTGAGKSSIMVALFRLSELSRGSITIDGIDVSQIGLHDLRKALAIIPQDPVLFQGTIRANLDPFNQCDDMDLWEALRRVHLLDGPETPEWEDTRFHLDEQVGDEGLNFSLGQRQLLAMARALVQRAKIIVMDEATSSVDFETDEQIQHTIKQEFKDATLLVFGSVIEAEGRLLPIACGQSLITTRSR
jgi:ABC-type multidrug transport system fused ATPase/permease subunit